MTDHHRETESDGVYTTQDRDFRMSDATYDFETDDPYMVENVSTTWTEEFEVIEPELTGIDFTPRYYFHFVLSHLLRTTFGDALGVPDNSDFGDNLDNLLEAEDKRWNVRDHITI